MSKEKRLKRLKQMWGSRSPVEIAQKLKISVRTVYRYAQELGLPRYEPPTLEDHLNVERGRVKLTTERRKSRELVKQVLVLERELEATVALSDARNYYVIQPPKPNGKRNAVVVMVASDWHVEEIVHRWQVNGVNKFNAEVCQERIGRFWRNSLKQIRQTQQNFNVDTVVLALLGDFISGSIHDELAEGNRLLPTDAIIEAQTHIASGIRFLLEHTKLKMVVVGKSGNHGRMTRKPRISTEAGNSLERYMYHSLSQMFKTEDRVDFVVGDGYHSYITLLDGFELRLHHGHSIRYYGGVGGISIPVNKAIAQWNKVRRADLDIFGHFHQNKEENCWVSNGSLVGFNAYALSIKAEPELPQQAFIVIDEAVGKRDAYTIFLDFDD